MACDGASKESDGQSVKNESDLLRLDETRPINTITRPDHFQCISGQDHLKKSKCRGDGFTTIIQHERTMGKPVTLAVQYNDDTYSTLSMVSRKTAPSMSML